MVLMSRLFFNSSMPRACSSLFQNIINDHPDCYATGTDGCIELLDGARKKFTNAVEFKASLEQDKIRKAYHAFCRGGLNAYASSLSNKPNIFLKARGFKSIPGWLDTFIDDYKIIVCVRNLKNILASLEKLYRKNPDKLSQWYITDEIRGTTIEKRVDMYLNNRPLGLDLDRMKDLFDYKLTNKFLFIKAEELTLDPKTIMSKLYKKLDIKLHDHNYSNIKQTIFEHDVLHEFDDHLHDIRNEIKPLIDDAEDVLGKTICNYIDNEYSWYQSRFNY